jgi:hypothetical protein
MSETAMIVMMLRRGGIMGIGTDSRSLIPQIAVIISLIHRVSIATHMCRMIR